MISASSVTTGRVPRFARCSSLPFPELIFRAQRIHRQHFDPAEVQISTLISIKTGGCREDCAYCPQSAHYQTSVKAEKLMRVDAVVAEAQAAKSAGASRFCIGAACIAEVEAFDPQTIQAYDDTSKAVALSASVDGALVQTFGKDTEEYRRYSRARPGWPSHSQIGCYGILDRVTASVCLDVEGPDDVAPLLGFVGDELAEIGGREREHVAT